MSEPAGCGGTFWRAHAPYLRFVPVPSRRDLTKPPTARMGTKPPLQRAVGRVAHSSQQLSGIPLDLLFKDTRWRFSGFNNPLCFDLPFFR